VKVGLIRPENSRELKNEGQPCETTPPLRDEAEVQDPNTQEVKLKLNFYC